MAAALITPTYSTLLFGGSILGKVKQVTQNDWIVLPHKGADLEYARLVTGAAAALTRGTLTVNNTGTAYTATTTSIAYDGGTVTRGTGSFFVETASGEILEVTDSAPTAASGTLTVLKRGCFGTTASATGVANDNTLYVLNSFVLGDNQTAAIRFSFRPLDIDPNVPLYA